jgi:hypothetical protein
MLPKEVLKAFVEIDGEATAEPIPCWICTSPRISNIRRASRMMLWLTLNRISKSAIFGSISPGRRPSEMIIASISSAVAQASVE